VSDYILQGDISYMIKPTDTLDLNDYLNNKYQYKINVTIQAKKNKNLLCTGIHRCILLKYGSLYNVNIMIIIQITNDSIIYPYLRFK
jgi:hypothetical protein